MSAVDLIKQLPAAFNPDAASGLDATLQFNISSPMHATIEGGECSVGEGPASSPDVTITMEDDDLVALFKGELNGMTAFMTGKLQIEGDLMLAQRMSSLFEASKLS